MSPASTVVRERRHARPLGAGGPLPAGGGAGHGRHRQDPPRRPAGPRAGAPVRGRVLAQPAQRPPRRGVAGRGHRRALRRRRRFPPEGFEARLALLLDLLRARRALLVLDNLETVLEPGAPAARYRAGMTGYGEVLRQLGESSHQGCLLVTSRERRPSWRRWRGHGRRCGRCAWAGWGWRRAGRCCRSGAWPGMRRPGRRWWRAMAATRWRCRWWARPSTWSSAATSRPSWRRTRTSSAASGNCSTSRWRGSRRWSRRC